jgi:membrane carboxypeptidase/penicillin-binding protein
VVRPGGTAANLYGQVPPSAWGKTGTSQAQRDAWFVGALPDLAAAVWVGYDQGTHSLPGEGAGVAGPIWAGLMRAQARLHPARPHPPPPGLVRVRVSSIDGLLPNPSSPTEVNYYLDGTQPRRRSPVWYTGPASGPLNPGYWYWQGHRRVPNGLPLSG